MRVLVLGGSGFVGRHLVAALAASGNDTIRILSRSPQRVFAGARQSLSVALEVIERLAETGAVSQEELADARERVERGEALLRNSVEVVEGDARDWPTVREALTNVEAVIHAVGIIRETEGRSYSDTNIGATQTLTDAMKDAGAHRLVYLGILGASDDPLLPYGRSRWLAEQTVTRSRLEWTIVKPSLVLGVSDAVSRRMVGLLRTGPLPVLPLPEGGRTLFQPIYVGDLVAILMQCLSSPERVGMTYEIGGPEYVSFRELVGAIAEELGIPRVIKAPMPRFALRAGAAVLGRIMRNPPITTAELGQLRTDNTTDLDSVQTAFGFTPRPLSEYQSYVRDVSA